MWESESESHGGGGGGGGVCRDHAMTSFDRDNHDSVKTDGFERRGQSWHVSSEIASDVLIKVLDSNFHLHKYPLLARSGKMNRILYASSSRDTEPSIVELDDLPGGPEAFELAAKFCYGVAVDLTASNISGLRCAAEYLEMTEDLEEGNLIFKTEAFLSYVVLSNWRDSIVVLKSCENLSPWAENLQIVRRCSESIAWKACASPRSIRWAYTGRVNSPKWKQGDSKESSPSRNQVPPDWWFEDASILRIDHFVRVITAIKVKGMRFELIGAAIVHYASKWLLGLAKETVQAGGEDSWNQAGLHLIVSGSNREDLTTAQIREQRMVIESLISIIPPQRDCVSCSFLLRLLKLANMLKVAPALVTELEKRVGMQLEQASLADLLIPSYNKSETMYDVDLVQRLVEHFLVQEQADGSGQGMDGFGDKHECETSARAGGGANAKMRVARLLDSYLTEVSRDRNLSLTKFQVLAESLPESARSCDDGMYRAVDSYLKAHPTLTEHERKRLCRVMDCQKLSIDACMHAAQNERLPLRIVVQVLFSEQVKISNAIASSSLKEAGEYNYHPMVSTRKQLLEGTPQSFQEGWAAAKKDINTLKFELESMKAKYLELQNDMDTLQRQFEKISPSKPTKQSSSSAWSSGWKKLSKLTKIGETNEMAEQMPAGTGEVVRKGPRRWRNSIS
ncbi:root phototropism protein 3-like [Iris pallida]|uniref:Root phototropism protein 3-like n=1 Tax=Iris pallida TaxID=29817 RepID=A0AAX6HRX4_IRIPA|nr:root phototropism protein 3-like [Iris pallida]